MTAHGRAWMNTGIKEPIMATSKLSHKQKGILDDQLFALRDKTVNGVRDFDQVRNALQDAIEGRFSEAPSADILARVERQLARYHHAGRSVAPSTRRKILEQAETFVPLSAADYPLVSGLFEHDSTDTVNQIWDCITFDGCSKQRNFDVSAPMRFAAGMEPSVTGPRLVHYDPNPYSGFSPRSAVQAAARDGVRVAGIEVMEMLFVEPELAIGWDGNKRPYPRLSGLEIDHRKSESGSWAHVPCLYRLDQRVYLDTVWRGQEYDYWSGGNTYRMSSPIVREC